MIKNTATSCPFSSGAFPYAQNGLRSIRNLLFLIIGILYEIFVTLYGRKHGCILVYILYTSCLQNSVHVYKHVYIPLAQLVYRNVSLVYENVYIMTKVYILFTVLHFHFFSVCLIEESTNLL